LICWPLLLYALTGCQVVESSRPAPEPSFEIRSTGDSEHVRHVRSVVENIIGHYCELFTLDESKIPLITIVLDDEEGAYDPEEHPALYRISTGSIHFRRKPDTMLLLHEIAHHFIFHRWGEVPIWFNEGLATYLAWSAMDGDHIVVGEVPVLYFRNLRTLARQGGLMPMAEFLSCPSARFYDSARSAGNYAQAWGLIFYLLHGRFPFKGSFHAELDRIHGMTEAELVDLESSFLQFCRRYSAVQLMVERLDSRDPLRKISSAFRLGLMQEEGGLDALLKLARDGRQKADLREVALYAGAMIVMGSEGGNDRSSLYKTLGILRHHSTPELRASAEILLDAFFREKVDEIVAHFAALGREQTFYPAARFIVVPGGTTGDGDRTVRSKNRRAASFRAPAPPTPP
jgi:hypothetical protein